MRHYIIGIVTLVLLKTLRPTPEENKNWLIENPDLILETTNPGEIPGLLNEVESLSRNGYFAAGFLTYESGYSFLPHMPEIRKTVLPLVWFALTKNPRNHESMLTMKTGENCEVKDIRLNLSSAEYAEKIQRIRNYIERGDTYQVNFTMRYHGLLAGSPGTLFEQLCRKQRVCYAAYIETDEWAVLSLSPELFFRKSGNKIQMRPMKGTAPRGRTLDEDRILAEALRNSEKECAENLMIVDLLRNDLGKICIPGSVEVSDPLHVETYETVLQMTSKVTGDCREDITVAEILKATFPSGSITGAPKIRTMQIIHELENDPREIYTGAIGYISREEAVFSVAIRTALIDRTNGEVLMGVGSGILHEADAVKEYEECELKGKFLTDPPLEFSLIETILWDPEKGFRHLELHMNRLIESAQYFLFPLIRENVLEHLNLQIPALRGIRAQQRVRILVDSRGNVSLNSGKVEGMPSIPRVCLARERVQSTDRFLFHKTTHRPLYDREFEIARSKGYFDVIFMNEHEEITEGAISNIFIVNSGQYFTPPLSCGVLAGTYRRYLMESGSIPVEERTICKDDLLNADALYLTNSIRGMIQVQLDDTHR